MNITEAKLAQMLADAAQAGAAAALAQLKLGDKVEAAQPKAGRKPKAAQPAKLLAAKQHCYEARMTRRADASRKGGAGMTKAEKSAVYAELKAGKPEDFVPSKAAWNKACKEFRGL
jgi:hypothetical protein